MTLNPWPSRLSVLRIALYSRDIYHPTPNHYGFYFFFFLHFFVPFLRPRAVSHACSLLVLPPRTICCPKPALVPETLEPKSLSLLLFGFPLYGPVSFLRAGYPPSRARPVLRSTAWVQRQRSYSRGTLKLVRFKFVDPEPLNPLPRSAWSCALKAQSYSRATGAGFRRTPVTGGKRTAWR